MVRPLPKGRKHARIFVQATITSSQSHSNFKFSASMASLSGEKEEALVLEWRTGLGLKYCRTKSNSRDQLCRELSKLYGLPDNGSSLEVFSSGTQATYILFRTISDRLLRQKHTFVLGSELYRETWRACEVMCKLNPDMTVVRVDVDDNQAITDALTQHGPEISLFFIESCSNPSAKMLDYSLVPVLRQLAPNCCFCVDNTWTTPYGFNPFKHGADVVIESSTKYLSGGTCIGGVMAGLCKWLDPAIEMGHDLGVFVGSDHCELLLAGLKTLPERIRRVSQLAQEAVNLLEGLSQNKDESQKQPYIDRIHHPLITYKQRNCLLELNPGVILFHVAADENQAKKLLKSLPSNQFLEFATSYGGKRSRIDTHPHENPSNYFDGHKSKSGQQPGNHGAWIRLSIGYMSDIDTVSKGMQAILASGTTA